MWYVGVMRRLAPMLAAAALAAAMPARARASQPSPREIAVRAAEAGAPDALSEKLTMTLAGTSGERGTRTLTTARMKTGTRGDATSWSARLEILTPKDVAGTVLLSVDRKDGNTDQYLYLPGLKRTRRIAGGQKGSSFQGSDFSYDDLGSRSIASADYTLLADEAIGGDACWQLVATPKKDVDSAWSKMILDVRKSDAVTLRARYYDAKGAETKRLDVDGTKLKSQGPTRIPLHLVMTTLATGHTTTLDVTDVKIDAAAKLTPALFDPASLE